MKKIIKTKAKAEVSPKSKTTKLDYKEMYESMKKLADNLKEEFHYEQNLRIDRGSIIDELNDHCDDVEAELDALKFDIKVIPVLAFFSGILVTLCVQVFF